MSQGILRLLFRAGTAASLLLTIVCFHANAAETGEGLEESWRKALAAETELNEMRPLGNQQKEWDDFLSAAQKKAGEVSDRFREHLEQYPDTPHLTEAREKWIEFLAVSALGSPEQLTKLNQVVESQLKDPQLTRSSRNMMRRHQIVATQDLVAREELIRADWRERRLAKRPYSSGTALTDIDFFCEQLLELADVSDYPKSLQLAEEILAIEPKRGQKGLVRSGEGEWYYHSKARKLKESLSRLGKPLELSFTSMDGTTINLSDYRGKVVLIDFWATWCPPCLRELPQTRKLWDQHSRDDLQIIGVSYDSDRAKLTQFLKDEKIPWPQYFSEEGRKSPIAQALGVGPIPTYWLVDRNGVLVDMNARRNLADKTARLIRQN